MGAETTIYLIDNDDVVRNRMANCLEHRGYLVSSFESGKSFLEKLDADSYGCIILDVTLPGMSGLEIQSELAQQGSEIPVIFVTADGDIKSSARAFKNGALDFIEKPYQTDTLLKRVAHAVSLDEARRDQKKQDSIIIKRFETLTKREVDIMTKLVQGVANHSNKDVAAELGISHRTVEVYRSRILDKMNASSITHLVEMAKTCGIHLP